MTLLSPAYTLGSLRENSIPGENQKIETEVSWTLYLWDIDSETVWMMCKQHLKRGIFSKMMNEGNGKMSGLK